MKKIFLVLFILFSKSSFSQQLNGLYRFSFSLFDDANLSYILFHKDEFVYFSLGSSTKVLDGTDELKKFGAGKYFFKANKFKLNFNTDSSIVTMNVYDSLATTFFSVPSQRNKKVSAQFSNTINDNPTGTLIIETTKKDYSLNLSSNKISIIQIPEKAIIKAIGLAIAGVPYKTLPFSNSFNNLNYTYYTKDDKEAIKIVSNQNCEFEIKKSIRIDSYRFGRGKALTKVDKKELDFLINITSKKELRLPFFLNYFLNY